MWVSGLGLLGGLMLAKLAPVSALCSRRARALIITVLLVLAYIHWQYLDNVVVWRSSPPPGCDTAAFGCA